MKNSYIDDVSLHSLEFEWSQCSYHGGEGRVQAGLCLAVVCIAVLVAAAVVDKADL